MFKAHRLVYHSTLGVPRRPSAQPDQEGSQVKAALQEYLAHEKPRSSRTLP